MKPWIVFLLLLLLATPGRSFAETTVEQDFGTKESPDVTRSEKTSTLPGLGMVFTTGATVISGWLVFQTMLRPPTGQVGSVLATMKDLIREFGDSRFHRGMTAEQIQKNAHRTASKLASNRKKLERFVPKLHADEELTIRLQAFLEKWPSEEAFLADLLAPESQGVQCGADITGLWMLAPDNKKVWKTPFPLFRP
jgi:hypothetical protein